jgi:hypothetical protein
MVLFFKQHMSNQPTINNPNLTAEAIVGGLSFPISMAFLDDNNILILEKEGSVFVLFQMVFCRIH